MFFSTYFHAPNLPLRWCPVAGAAPHTPHSCLPHTPATFRDPLCPKIDQYQTQGHFLKINTQSSLPASQKPCREFHPKSQSDLSAGWQLLPIMKGLLISVSKGWEIRIWTRHDCTICAVDIYWFIPSSHLSLTLQSIRGHNQLFAGIPPKNKFSSSSLSKNHFEPLLQKMDHLFSYYGNRYRAHSLAF